MIAPRKELPLQVRLEIQRMPAVSEQTLAVVGLLSLSRRDGVFSTSELVTYMAELRLPTRTNLSRDLGNLRSAGLVLRPSPTEWALTPLGETRAHAMLPQFTGGGPQVIEAASLGGRARAVVPPLVASGVTPEGLGRLVSGDAFDRNVMLITRFPSSLQDPLAALVPGLKAACAAHGLVLHVASDAQLEDTVWANVVTYMWGCRYAIVILDAPDATLNSNVLIEIGGMLMTGRRCAVLKDTSVPRLPTDLVSQIFKEVDLQDVEECLTRIHDWLRDDLGMGSCGVDCVAGP